MYEFWEKKMCLLLGEEQHTQGKGRRKEELVLLDRHSYSLPFIGSNKVQCKEHRAYVTRLCL